MKFTRSIEYAIQVFFFESHSKYETGRLVLDIFLFFKNAWCEVKASGDP